MHAETDPKSSRSQIDKDLPPFQVAFQPIVDVERRCVVAYEALTRGMNNESYPQLVAGLSAKNRRRFDRVTASAAIELAVKLGLRERGTSLSLNVRPDVHDGALDASFIAATAASFGLGTNRVLLELTEDHKLGRTQLMALLEQNKRLGFATGMDDFGAGYSGLTMLADVCPEVLKLDRHLIIDIENSESRQRIVAAFAEICRSMNIVLVAEGIETGSSCMVLRELGIVLMQGYLFARPMLGALPCVQGFPNWSHRESHEELPVPIGGTAQGWFDADFRCIGHGGEMLTAHMPA